MVIAAQCNDKNNLLSTHIPSNQCAVRQAKMVKASDKPFWRPTKVTVSLQLTTLSCNVISDRYLGVAEASSEPPKFIHLTYTAPGKSVGNGMYPSLAGKLSMNTSKFSARLYHTAVFTLECFGLCNILLAEPLHAALAGSALHTQKHLFFNATARTAVSVSSEQGALC
jgi:hypothetical protein